MSLKNNKKFFIDSYEFLSHLSAFFDSSAKELNPISVDDYKEKFDGLNDGLVAAKNKINDFLEYWNEDDGYKICSTLRTINEYIRYYIVTIKEACPSSFMRNAKYLKDSLTTAKLALDSKIRFLKENGK